MAANSIAKGFFPDVVVAEFASAACIFILINGFTVHDVDKAIFGVRTDGQSTSAVMFFLISFNFFEDFHAVSGLGSVVVQFTFRERIRRGFLLWWASPYTPPR